MMGIHLAHRPALAQPWPARVLSLKPAQFKGCPTVPPPSHQAHT